MEIDETTAFIDFTQNPKEVVRQTFNHLSYRASYFKSAMTNFNTGHTRGLVEEETEKFTYFSSGSSGDFGGVHVYDDYIISVILNIQGELSLRVASSDLDLVKSTLKYWTDKYHVSEKTKDKTQFYFWYATSMDYCRDQKDLVTPTWPAIERNYSKVVKTSVEKLVALDTPDDTVGRILLLHGQAGTGKTTLIRALSQEWKDWCQFEYVIDPERLFTDSAYLVNVLLKQNASWDEVQKPWRILVLEDCDELIRADAKKISGQAMSRLLNLTDGILGQGQNIMILITTNEDVAELYPAVVRPGRCLAQLEVGKLSFSEAVEWLGTSAGISSEMTLAELFALKNGGDVIESEHQLEPTGMYL